MAQTSTSDNFRLPKIYTGPSKYFVIKYYILVLVVLVPCVYEIRGGGIILSHNILIAKENLHRKLANDKSEWINSRRVCAL